MQKANIIEQLDIDIDEDSQSTPFAVPVVIVGKKDGSKRFCVDYRRLNKITTTNPYPLPIIDLASGYWHVPVHPNHIHKTTFTCHLGLYSFLQLPFRLKNVPASFQSMTDLIFRDQIDKHLAVFINDIIINVYSQTFEEHMDHIRQTFKKCRKYSLRLKKKMCHFACEQLEFLGHVVSSKGLMVDDRKIEAIQEYGAPKNVQQVKRFLGMTGYYARFVNRYQGLAIPLTRLTRKKQQFEWTPETEKAMQAIKDALTTALVLAYPNKLQPFILTTDASDTGLGAVLSQFDPEDETEYAVAYASKAMSPAERNYNTTHREGLAVIWAVEKFQRYLRGRKFKIITDHAALISIIKNLEPRGRVGRWAMKLSEYEFTIEHRNGEDNKFADALSRDPRFESEVNK